MTNLRTALLLLVLFFVSATLAHAEQFVLIDVTFTFTKEDAFNSKPNQSHYYVRGDKVNPDQPKDWTTPIDYRNGTVHLRLEVLEKPEGSQPTSWSICYIPNKGLQHGYGCIGTGVYKEKGVIEKDLPMTGFWQNDNIDWTQGIKEMHLVIKDDHNTHAHKLPDPDKFFPTKVRVTLVQVSKGATYDPKAVAGISLDGSK